MDDEESEEEEKVDDMQLLESPVQEYNINELESSGRSKLYMYVSICMCTCT